MLGSNRPVLAIKLITSVAGSIRPVGKRCNPVAFQAGVDLVETAYDPPGLICKGQRLNGALRQLAFHEVREILRNLHFPFQTASESTRLYRCRNAGTIGGYPDATSGQLACQIRVNRVPGTGDKANQLPCRAF